MPHYTETTAESNAPLPNDPEAATSPQPTVVDEESGSWHSALPPDRPSDTTVILPHPMAETIPQTTATTTEAHAAVAEAAPSDATIQHPTARPALPQEKASHVRAAAPPIRPAKPLTQIEPRRRSSPLRSAVWLVVFLALSLLGYTAYRSVTGSAEGLSYSGAVMHTDGTPLHVGSRGSPPAIVSPAAAGEHAASTLSSGIHAGFTAAPGSANSGSAIPSDMPVTTTSVADTEDTIGADPPNGMVFAGTGRFQIYRQGNLTWRVNTDSGTACVLFATDAEWRKSKVYSHGCRQASQAM